jgi:hypothetical protein
LLDRALASSSVFDCLDALETVPTDRTVAATDD